jgi:hypothetical protein
LATFWQLFGNFLATFWQLFGNFLATFWKYVVFCLTPRLTKEFERLSQPEEVRLLSAPKIVPKKTAEELAAEAINVKTGGRERADSSANDWKWKQGWISQNSISAENFFGQIVLFNFWT